VLQENHYYAFGLEMEGEWQKTNTAGDQNRYQYNGKELSPETGLYAYGARYYDPTIGRFTGVDPISDQFPHVSTYNYAENEPVGSIDLHGLQRLKVTDIGPMGLSTEYPTTERRHFTTQLGAIAKHPIVAAKVGAYQPNSNNISTTTGRFAAHIDNKIGLDNAAGAAILPDDIGGYQNALRHGLWSAAIASAFGSDAAKDVTNSHEGIGVGQSGSIDWSRPNNGDALLNDSMVDFLNNQIGISIGEANPDATVSELAELVLTEFADNGLWTATQDDNGNITIQRAKISEGQRRQGNHIISELLDENGREKK
jgi:RHS repeat-associated protein